MVPSKAGALNEENRSVNAAISKNMVRPRKKSREDNRLPDCKDVVEADTIISCFTVVILYKSIV